MTTFSWQRIISIIEGNRTFVLTSHSNPDCDALGSELALAEHLRVLGKKVAIINSDAVPSLYRFLDPQQTIKQYSPKEHTSIINQADVIIVLDASGGWERTGRVGQALEQTRAVKICIDHHPDATNFVDVAIIDTDAAATAELVYDLLLAMNGVLSENMAQILYAAILTDTGSFRFPKTRAQTHRTSADLLAAGANPQYIYRQLYEQYSPGYVQLKGHVMASIKTTADDQIAYYTLEQSTLERYGVKASDLDGFPSLGQAIGNVRVTIFCMETSDNRVKISLRSDGTVAINQIALEYNGGGHPTAAGATVTGKLEQVTAELVERVKDLLEAETGEV
jgi:phosphoesterase RecJ-like protein